MITLITSQARQQEQRSHTKRLNAQCVQAHIAQDSANEASANKDQIILNIQKQQDLSIRHVNEELARKEFGLFELLREVEETKEHALALTVERDRLLKVALTLYNLN